MSGAQIPTSVTIIDNLKGFNAMNMSALDTTSASSILAGSVVEVAGAFYTFSLNETPSLTTISGLIENACYLMVAPSGTAGSQILTASWTNTTPTWVSSKNGWYASSGSVIRAVFCMYNVDDAQYTDKTLMVNENTSGLSNRFRGITAGVYGSSKAGSGVLGVASLGVGVEGRASSVAAGVYGTSSYNAGDAIYGFNSATTGNAMHGYSTGASSNAVRGECLAAGGYDFYAAGAGTNYGPFTGGHEVKIESDDFIKGMLLSCTGKVHKRDGSISSTLPCVKKSYIANDKAIFGVFNSITLLNKDHWYNPEPDEKFATCNALGEGRVLVTNINGDLQLGDYITTSTVEGYGQRQDDDLLHSYTLGKVTETVDWSSVKKGKSGYKEYLIACVYVSA